MPDNNDITFGIVPPHLQKLIDNMEADARKERNGFDKIQRDEMEKPRIPSRGFVAKHISEVFQETVVNNIVYDFQGDLRLELAYLAAGLNEEAGEASGKVKKYLRGDFDLEYQECEVKSDRDLLEREDYNKEVNKRRKQAALELGDCLWYLTNMARVLGYSLEEIMQMNMDKLRAREAANTIRGEGDER